MPTSRWALLLVVAAAFAPSALALDTFPAHESWGEHEARLLLRLPEGGALRVVASAGARVAAVDPGAVPEAFSSTPARFVVEAASPSRSWHGLPGVVELVVVRDDPGEPVTIEVHDEAGAGALYEWPAASRRDVPSGAPLAVGAGLVAASFMRREHEP